MLSHSGLRTPYRGGPLHIAPSGPVMRGNGDECDGFVASHKRRSMNLAATLARVGELMLVFATCAVAVEFDCDASVWIAGSTVVRTG